MRHDVQINLNASMRVVEALSGLSTVVARTCCERYLTRHDASHYSKTERRASGTPALAVCRTAAASPRHYDSCGRLTHAIREPTVGSAKSLELPSLCCAYLPCGHQWSEQVCTQRVRGASCAAKVARTEHRHAHGCRHRRCTAEGRSGTASSQKVCQLGATVPSSRALCSSTRPRGELHGEQWSGQRSGC